MNQTIRRSYQWLLFALAISGFLVDQASKYGVFRVLEQEDSDFAKRDLIPGVFQFHVEFNSEEPPCDCVFVRMNSEKTPHVNKGALWGLGGNQAQGNRIFTIASGLAILGISLWSFRRNVREDRLLCISLGLIMGGALGNMYDRIVFQGVRDFMHFYAIRWPVFNFADCCLVCGAILLLIQSWFTGKSEVSTTAPQVAPTSPTE
ncbi:MAG: signal peptidase II [Zavarzinella sp.]